MNNTDYQCLWLNKFITLIVGSNNFVVCAKWFLILKKEKKNPKIKLIYMLSPDTILAKS